MKITILDNAKEIKKAMNIIQRVEKLKFDIEHQGFKSNMVILGINELFEFHDLCNIKGHRPYTKYPKLCGLEVSPIPEKEYLGIVIVK
jgi:hypothetical protein